MPSIIKTKSPCHILTRSTSERERVSNLSTPGSTVSINSPSSYGSYFSGGGSSTGLAQRKRLKAKMYKCLLKYSVVEYRQIEPYVELLYQCFRRFLPLANEDYNFNANSAFGEEFKLAAMALIILSISKMFSAISGSVGTFLQMVGKQNIFQNILILTAIINIGLNYILIPKHGIDGAAFASAISGVIWNVLMIIYIKKN